MLKKSDIIPLILAAITTAIIVRLGYNWAAKVDNARLIDESKIADGNALDESSTEDTSQLSTKTALDSPQVFVTPAIVPAGTAVAINGSSKMMRINQALKRGFHRQFPGTAIITDADGNARGINQLTSGGIDVAAIDRPLSKGEKSSGLAAIKIFKSSSDKSDNFTSDLYYVYQKPANAEAEAFLGFVLSPQGQKTINQL